MTFSEVFAALRKKEGLSQNEMAERLFVTRQAALSFVSISTKRARGRGSVFR